MSISWIRDLHHQPTRWLQVVTPVIFDVQMGCLTTVAREDYIERFGCEPPEEKDWAGAGKQVMGIIM